MSTSSETVDVIACGALAREIMVLRRANQWEHMRVSCLPASLHNVPSRIPEAVRQKITKAREDGLTPVVAYGDCGTGGLLDDVCREEGVERIDGAHCYAFYLGVQKFAEIMEREPTAFFLTDFLSRHFDALVWRGLGLDTAPQLIDMYFRNYRKVIFITQTGDPELMTSAREAAARLSLVFETVVTGYGDLGNFLTDAAARYVPINSRPLSP